MTLTRLEFDRISGPRSPAAITLRTNRFTNVEFSDLMVKLAEVTEPDVIVTNNMGTNAQVADLLLGKFKNKLPVVVTGGAPAELRDHQVQDVLRQVKEKELKTLLLSLGVPADDLAVGAIEAINKLVKFQDD